MSPDHVDAYGPSQFHLQKKYLKTKRTNPRHGYCHTKPKNEIEYNRCIGNQAWSMNMLLFSRKSARMEKHDSMFRGDFVSTYSAIQWTLGRVCGCFGFSEWQGRKLRACFDLKTLATMF